MTGKLIWVENADDTFGHGRIWPTLARGFLSNIRYVLRQGFVMFFSFMPQHLRQEGGVDCETSQQLTRGEHLRESREEEATEVTGARIVLHPHEDFRFTPVLPQTDRTGTGKRHNGR